MQEIHSIGSVNVFGVSEDKIMKSHNNQNHHQQSQHHNHALKCPRCDSFNTKFCYYNNYNLSQPRHFCKNCRRYWTKGGVLRNVPVGGGSRKSKHTRNSKAVASSSTAAPAATALTPEAEEHKSNSYSNSESSTFTAATAMEAISNTPLSNLTVNSVSENEQVNSFTNLVASSSKNDAFSFGNDASSFRFGVVNHQNQQQQGNDQVHVVQRGDSSGFCQLQQQSSHQRLSLLNNQQLSNDFGSLDWQASVGNCLFDVPNTVDQSYWTHSHWSDHHVNHSSLFHLPSSMNKLQ